MSSFSSCVWAVSFSCALLSSACGDDSPLGGGTSGGGNVGGSGVGGSGAGSQGGAAAGGGGEGGGAEYPPVDCGDDLTCDAGSVCIVEPNEPECTNLGEGESCPKGTTETNCGGAGIPCCCGPTPPPDHRCLDASACGGALPSCDCLDPCTADDSCIALASSEYAFQCEPLPAP